MTVIRSLSDQVHNKSLAIIKKKRLIITKKNDRSLLETNNFIMEEMADGMWDWFESVWNSLDNNGRKIFFKPYLMTMVRRKGLDQLADFESIIDSYIAIKHLEATGTVDSNTNHSNVQPKEKQTVSPSSNDNVKKEAKLQQQRLIEHPIIRSSRILTELVQDRAELKQVFYPSSKVPAGWEDLYGEEYQSHNDHLYLLLDPVELDRSIYYTTRELLASFLEHHAFVDPKATAKTIFNRNQLDFLLRSITYHRDHLLQEVVDSITSSKQRLDGEMDRFKQHRCLPHFVELCFRLSIANDVDFYVNLQQLRERLSSEWREFSELWMVEGFENDKAVIIDHERPQLGDWLKVVESDCIHHARRVFNATANYYETLL